MEREEKSDKVSPDLIDEVFLYLTEHKYREGATANHKRAIRNKCKKFSVRDGELFYTNVKRGRGHSKVWKFKCAYSITKFVYMLYDGHMHLPEIAMQPANEVKYITSKEEKQRILKSCHMDPTSGHMGIKRTLSQITDRFMWPGVAKDVENLVSCICRTQYELLLITLDIVCVL